ncbi:hypothetical protein Acsp06_62720 [Actinomycetospora sp. NBRC 106375]|nr:hypothetical protein Acsp06_62720 [Actinomycetospora sp. NBRC 106375]
MLTRVPARRYENLAELGSVLGVLDDDHWLRHSAEVGVLVAGSRRARHRVESESVCEELDRAVPPMLWGVQ